MLAVPRDSPGVALPSDDMVRPLAYCWASKGLLMTCARGVAWSAGLRAANEEAGDRVGEAVSRPPDGVPDD
jgi:hypothetical protein